MRMRYLYAIAAALLAGCAPSGLSPQLAKPDRPSICEQGHFQEFLDQFSEDVRVQRKHTEFPLHKREYHHVTTQVEPVPFESVLKESEVRFPVYPSPNELHERSLKAEVAGQVGRKAEVRVSRADTDYLVVYSFEHQACWKLTRIEDQSQ